MVREKRKQKWEEFDDTNRPTCDNHPVSFVKRGAWLRYRNLCSSCWNNRTEASRAMTARHNARVNARRRQDAEYKSMKKYANAAYRLTQKLRGVDGYI